jgi:uncharacterized protein (DUF1778 family)
LDDPGQRDLVEQAAKLHGESVATFVRRAALQVARDSLARAEALELAATKAHSEPLIFTGAAAEQLEELLENPPPFNDYLKESLRLLAEMKKRTAHIALDRSVLRPKTENEQQ